MFQLMPRPLPIADSASGWRSKHAGSITMSVKMKKIIRAFAPGHIGGYPQPWEDPTNCRYRNVILTNALLPKSCMKIGHRSNSGIKGLRNLGIEWILSILIEQTERSDTTNLQSSIVNLQFRVGLYRPVCSRPSRSGGIKSIPSWAWHSTCHRCG